MPVQIFDGHCDTLTRLFGPNATEPRDFLCRNAAGHLDLPRAREGGFAGGFFAIFIPHGPSDEDRLVQSENGYRVELPPPLPHGKARAETDVVLDGLWRLLDRATGRICLVRTITDFDGTLERGELALVLHFEGAEAIDPELRLLDTYYDMGLRSLGIVWSRPNDFGHGVPFQFPHSPDTGPGLTAPGRALVRRCNELGILVDAAHMNERGFWDLAEETSAPLAVTHSAAHRLCPSTRNLTDAQIDAIAETGGLIGIAFTVCNLRSDGDLRADTPLTDIVRHAAYIAERAGVEHVALGSDFDGAVIPEDLGDAAGLPRLVNALREGGFSESDLELLARGNWRRVLDATWKPVPPT